VVDGIEETTDIGVKHPVHSLSFEGHRERIQCLMSTTSRPKSVRKPEKLHLINRVEDFNDRPLNDLIFQRCDTQRALPAIPFGDKYPTRRFRSVRSSMQPIHKRPQIFIE